MLKDADGYYITEDRVEKTGNNCFMHLGRADGIIKVAGKRVDLREIENKVKQSKYRLIFPLTPRLKVPR